MDRSQAKSAPPRLKSKFVKNRTNAMKEIQAWIKKDEEFSVPEASRMSGQLSDNVTEERMLKAKLWELSKERYKFLSQNSYEKKVFQDRQQRKANARRVASASADCRSRHTSEDARKERRSSLGDTPVQKPRIRNARLALLNRLDPTNKKKGGKKASNATSVDKDGKESPSRSYSRTNSRTSVLQHKDSTLSIKSGVGIKPNATNSDAKRVGTPLGRRAFNVTSDSGPDARRPASSLSVSRTGKNTSLFTTATKTSPGLTANNENNGPAPSSQDQSPGTSNPIATAQGSWGKCVPAQCSQKYGMRVESKTTDPRYALLEERLSPLIQSNTTSDVSSIVNTIESLHIRPRRRPADSNRSRTKIEVKALEFIKERGFVF